MIEESGRSEDSWGVANIALLRTPRNVYAAMRGSFSARGVVLSIFLTSHFSARFQTRELRAQSSVSLRGGGREWGRDCKL